MHLFVTCPRNVESLLVEELATLGFKARAGFAGAFVPFSMDTIYTINYCSRLATRVLMPLTQFPCSGREDLYNKASKIDWTQFLTLDKTFAIDANVSHHDQIRHSHFAALVIKDAICDQLRDKWGQRPNVDSVNPDVQFNLYLDNASAALSIDTSGVPLYKRGYRTASGPAPLQENLACALLKIAGYSAQDILCDPFCGSGTILIEAQLLATKTPPGYLRKEWGFFHLPAFDPKKWEAVKARFDDQILFPAHQVFGADKDPQAVAIAQKHCTVAHKDIRSYYPPAKPTLIVTNPPYGKRLSASSDIYKALGRLISPNTRAYVLCADTPSHLKVLETHPLHNGGLPVNLLKVHPS